jgi:hypothetical protein
MYRYAIVGVWIWVVIFSVCSPIVLADASIRVRPHLGGSELDFDQVGLGVQEINREVDVVISGTTTQYELRQEPLSPLRSARGDEISWNNFVVRGLIGTNKFGRLEINSKPVANTVLYTSNQGGSPDSFSLIYTLNTLSGIQPGFYRGRLRFNFIPISGGQGIVSVILNVVVNVRPSDGQEKTFIDITSARGTKIIYLNPNNPEQKRSDVVVKVQGRFKQPFTIKQILVNPLTSGEGNTLAPESVNTEVRAVNVGTGMPLTALSVAPQVVYKSRPTGEADENFVITYSLSDTLLQRAGRYRSRLQYVIEEMGLEIDRKLLELEIENEPVFDLIIIPQDVGGAIEFRNVVPGEGVGRSEVVIEVKSNLGKRYQVNQNVIAPLTDKEGRVIEAKYLTVHIENLDTKGTVKLPESQEVKTGDTVLFVSDKEGSPDKFKVVYELESPKEGIRAGDYSTRISYSLLEI